MTATRQFLPMWGVRDQRLRRGGINAAYTQIGSTGLQDACVSLWRKVTEVLQARPQDQVYLTDLDKLVPSNLTQMLRARLNGVVELSDPGLDLEELRKRLFTLQAVHARGVAKPCREALSHAQRAVEETLEKLQLSLKQAFATGADKMRAVSEQVRRFLHELNYPPSDLEPLGRLQRSLKAFAQFQARRSALTPASFEFVTAQLLNQGQRAYEDALHALALELCEDAYRLALPKLLAFLDDLAGRGADFTQKMSAALAQLEHIQKQAAQEQYVSRASVVLPLKGPDEKQVLAGMIARHSCTDVTHLAVRLLDRLEARLRELAPAVCPYLDAQTSSFPDLLRAFPTAQLAAVFLRLVEESMGGGHTVYEIIAQHGVEETANFLYRRAAPTCHLGDHDVEAFNISPATLTIGRLPPAVGPRDPEIRANLKAALENNGPCDFTEGAATDRSVTVVRLHLGWPIGIAEENRALLDRYVRGAERGHLPHLIGIVPDSPLAEASPSVKELANALQR